MKIIVIKITVCRRQLKFLEKSFVRFSHDLSILEKDISYGIIRYIFVVAVIIIYSILNVNYDKRSFSCYFILVLMHSKTFTYCSLNN